MDPDHLARLRLLVKVAEAQLAVTEAKLALATEAQADIREAEATGDTEREVSARELFAEVIRW